MKQWVIVIAWLVQIILVIKVRKNIQTWSRCSRCVFCQHRKLRPDTPPHTTLQSAIRQSCNFLCVSDWSICTMMDGQVCVCTYLDTGHLGIKQGEKCIEQSSDEDNWLMANLELSSALASDSSRWNHWLRVTSSLIWGLICKGRGERENGDIVRVQCGPGGQGKYKRSNNWPQTSLFFNPSLCRD